MSRSAARERSARRSPGPVADHSGNAAPARRRRRRARPRGRPRARAARGLAGVGVAGVEGGARLRGAPLAADQELLLRDRCGCHLLSCSIRGCCARCRRVDRCRARHRSLRSLSPPSTATVAPVMNALSSLARKTTTRRSPRRRVAAERDHLRRRPPRTPAAGAPIASTSIAVWKALSVGPGMDRVDADPGRRHLLGGGAHQADERVLGGRVGADAARPRSGRRRSS